MNITIRKMHYEDTKQVQSIAKTTWNATYEGIIPLEVQNNFLKSNYSDESMIQRIERSIVYVAEVEGKVVGFANYSTVRDGGKVELAAIYLYPEFQSKGIGTALIQQAVKELKGMKEIYINVEKDNKIGLSFYEAKGFEIVKESDLEFDGHILKQVRMVKKFDYSANRCVIPGRIHRLFGGIVEEGESLKDAAVRETKEESGIDIEVLKFCGIFQNVNKSICNTLFLAKPIGGELTTSSESLEVGFYPIEKALEMVTV